LVVNHQGASSKWVSGRGSPTPENPGFWDPGIPGIQDFGPRDPKFDPNPTKTEDTRML